jgi:hypothetical protein
VASGRPRSATHFCPGKCSRTVSNTLFACSSCWGRLPHELQAPITENYQRDAAAHMAAMAAACDWYRQNPPAPVVEERCERTELLVDQCACPAHRGGSDPDHETLRIRALLLAKPNWFAARYAGSCDCCGERFQEGTAIRMDLHRGWRAECCAEEGADRG